MLVIAADLNAIWLIVGKWFCLIVDNDFENRTS